MEARLAALRAVLASDADWETAYAVLGSALKSENINLRLGACVLLAEQTNRENAEEMAWDTVMLLEDCSPYVRTMAAKILAGLGPHAINALPALSKAFAEKANRIPNRYEMDDEVNWSLFDSGVQDLQNQTVRSAVSSALAAIQNEASPAKTDLLAKETNR